MFMFASILYDCAMASRNSKLMLVIVLERENKRPKEREREFTYTQFTTHTEKIPCSVKIEWFQWRRKKNHYYNCSVLLR